MGRGLSRSRSRLPSQVKRSRSRSVAGELVHVEEDQFEPYEEETIENEEVLTKYKASGKIANSVVEEIVAGLQPGASVIELTKLGDKLIKAKTGEVFTKELDDDGVPILKGISFPCCINVNHIVCYFHPREEHEDVIINPGDVVRIECGVHIDGYISTIAHTIIVPSSNPDSIDYTIQCDVLRAAFSAGSAALRVMKPGCCNHDVTEVFRSVAHSFGVLPCQGVLSHRMKRFEEQGNEVILGWQNLEDHQLQDSVIFKPNQVWSLDVVMINGGPSNNVLSLKNTSLAESYIFRRTEVLRSQRVKAARYVLSVLRENGPSGTLPFTYDWFDNPKTARLGLFMLIKEQLVDPFPVLYCKEIQTVARYKWTVLIQENGVRRIAGLDAPDYAAIDPKRLDKDVRQLLNEPTTYSSQPKKNKNKKQRTNQMVEMEP